MAKHSPVSKDLAKACVDNYHKTFKEVTDPKIREAFTSDMVFNKAELVAWLNTISTDSVKISLGIYTPEFSAKYPTAKTNRLTGFIFPFNSPGAVKAQVGGDPDPGDGDDPFNLSELTP